MTYYRVVPTSGTSIPVVSSGDVKFSLVVFASGEEDISSITLSGSSGSYTLEYASENLENVQLTPRANATVWWDESASSDTTVSIHSSVANITIDLVARYY